MKLSRSMGNGPTHTEIARTLQLGKVTLGVTLERLEEKHFMVRKTAAHDRRLKVVFLNEQSRQALGKVSHVPDPR